MLIEKTSNLEGWQKSQNGNIKHVEGKLDKLLYIVLAEAIGIVGILLALILGGFIDAG